MLLATNGLGLIIPRIFKTAVDTLTRTGGPAHQNVSFLTNAAIAAVALAALAAIFRVLSRISFFYTGRRVEADIRNDLFAHLLTQGGGFYEDMRTGELMSRAVNDISNVRMMAGFSVLNLINTAVQGVMVISQMIAMSPRLTLYSVLPLPVLVFAVSRISRGLFKRSLEVQEGLAEISSFAQEDLTGLETLQAYAQEPAERERFAGLNSRYLRQNISLSRVRSSVAGVMVAYGGIGSLVVLGLGGHAVIRGGLTIGALLAFGMYLTMLTWPTMALGWLITVVQRGMASMKRIEDVLDRPPAIEVKDPVQIDKIEGELFFDHLSFTYPKSRDGNGTSRIFSLREITEHIRPGMRVAIVGPTGSGKSTIVKFIPRLLDVQNGSIRIDGTELRRIPLGVLRGRVGFVSQEPFLFSATIHDNVAMGNRSATAHEVHEAIRRAGLSPDIEEFPSGDKTVVGERGITLSGGQRQRVTLARTLVSDPRILILDDVLSSVDAETERNILRELSDYMKGRTSIVITHRLSAISDFDLILVVDDGRIVERGLHRELMEARGLYRRLVERQAIEEELEKL